MVDSVKNHFKLWRTWYGIVSDILSQSGFDWDNTKYMITVENEIAWNEYVKVVNHLFNFIYYSIEVIICVVINMFLFFFKSHEEVKRF